MKRLTSLSVQNTMGGERQPKGAQRLQSVSTYAHGMDSVCDADCRQYTQWAYVKKLNSDPSLTRPGKAEQ